MNHRPNLINWTPESRAKRRASCRKTYTTKAVARFWSMVVRTDPAGCWLWTGAVNEKGYGRLSWPSNRNAKAHRVAFLLANGRWPAATLHSCDTRACCNPAHLSEGTQAENLRQMRERGRAFPPPLNTKRDSIGRWTAS